MEFQFWPGGRYYKPCVNFDETDFSVCSCAGSLESYRTGNPKTDFLMAGEAEMY